MGTTSHRATPQLPARGLRARGLLSRAELLLALELGQNPRVCAPEPEAEFVAVPRAPAVELPLDLSTLVPPLPAPTPNSPQPSTPGRDPLQRLWVLSELTVLADAAPVRAPEEPLPALPAVSAEAIARAYAAAEAPATRTGWRRLCAQLQAQLGAHQGPRAPDWSAACAKLARAQPLWPLPRQRPRKWPGSLVVLEDGRGDLALYAGEWKALRVRLARQIGKSGVRSHVLRHAYTPLPALPHGQPVLLLSDALCSGGDAALARWAERVQRHGYRLLAWQPAAGHAGKTNALRAGAPVGSGDPALQQLLALVFLLRYVEDALLRALAVRWVPGWGALGLLHALQRHPALQRGYCGYAIAPESLADPAFVQEMKSVLEAMAPDALRGTLKDWWTLHAVLAEVDRLSPALRFPSLLPQLAGETEPLNAHARKLLLQTLPTAMQQPSTLQSAALSALRAARLLAPSCAAPEQSALSWLYHHAQQQLGGAEQGGEGRSDMLPPEGEAPSPWQLRHVGEQLLLEPAAAGPLTRAAILSLPLTPGALIHVDAPQRPRALRLGSAPLELAQVADLEAVADRAQHAAQLKLRTPHYHLTLTGIQCPQWALGCGRDPRGAFVLAPTPLGKPHRFDLPEGPDLDPEHPLLLRGQRELIAVLPDAPGAKLSLGVDRCGFGLYASISIKNATQVLRWLAPGEFWMGSPDGVGDRRIERPRHLVRLTEGLWLADTACTQAFWLAVVGGKNPSQFQGTPNLPVERVSWNDITTRFLPQLQAALGGAVQAQLPSEAEWEYACRAGTATPFWFGAKYNGNFPYGKAAKGLDRGRTVPVASSPKNAWGLYEMHGNVWEWCRDSPREYDSAPISDPEGPQAAPVRVLRGGAWLYGTVFARSAYRYANHPGLSLDYFGFRFGLRSLSPALGHPKAAAQPPENKSSW